MKQWLKNSINWRLYWLLLIASVLAIAAVLPYAFTLSADVLAQAPFSTPVLALISIVQSTVLFAILIFFGLQLSSKVGFEMPLITSYLEKKPVAIDIKKLVRQSIWLGVASGLAIILADYLFTMAGVQLSLAIDTQTAWWMGLLASFYGGIGEEIVLRLFFMSFLVWLLSKTIKSSKPAKERNILMWSAILLATIVFGLGHLPITASLTTLTAGVIARALVLNGIGGLVFGYLFWKKGLESAMIAHFSADIVLHVLLPIFITNFL